MFERILVPLDGSTLSDEALAYVTPLAKAFSAEVLLLHVVASVELLRMLPPSYPYADLLRREASNIGRSFLERAAESLRKLGITVQTAVTATEDRSITEMLLDYAQKENVQLIAMATHGQGGLDRVIFGSVANRTLLASESPLLLVRPTGEYDEAKEAALGTVIVPLDGSELAESVLPFAEELAQKLGLEIRLLYVLPLASQIYVGPTYYMYPADLLDVVARDAAKAYLKGVADRLQQSGLRIHTEVEEGEAGSLIVDYARRTPDSLVALSTHGRSGIGRWLLGSVADKVIRSSGRPVFVVRPPAE
jgi:nucleotide-binding universal stress UspA family protein